MATEKLSRAAVAERALRLGDEEGLEAVTIRRLAQALGVTPMALYWHFKNKDELLLGIVDHVLSGLRADREASDPWPAQLRAMVETLVTAMRAHPILADLLHSVNKEDAPSFNQATDDALSLLARGGFSVQEAFWVAGHLMYGAIGLVAGQPECPVAMPADRVVEWRRQKRLKMERLPAGQFPMLVAFAATYQEEPDPERYFRFGVDLLMAGVEAIAPGLDGSARDGSNSGESAASGSGHPAGRSGRTVTP